MAEAVLPAAPEAPAAEPAEAQAPPAAEARAEQTDAAPAQAPADLSPAAATTLRQLVGLAQALLGPAR